MEKTGMFCMAFKLKCVPRGTTWDNYRILIPKGSAFSCQTPYTLSNLLKRPLPGLIHFPTTPKVNA